MPCAADAVLSVPTDVLARVHGLTRPLLLAHVNPDADALGSLLSMALGLRALGQRPIVPMPAGSISARLQWLADLSGMTFDPAEAHADADGIVVLDTARSGRANCQPKLEKLAGARPVINIDHHSSNTQYGQLNWVCPQASSASELVALLVDALDIWPALPADEVPVVASLLYAGILCDTIGFSLPNTSAGSLHIAARLVDRGARVDDIGLALLRSVRPNEFALLKTIYANTRVVADGLIAYSQAHLAEITAAGCQPIDVDSQVDIPRSIAGIRLALLFTETRPGTTRINFRGEGGFRVLALAQQFGGGGHDFACGAVLEGPFETTVTKVLAAAEQAIRSA